MSRLEALVRLYRMALSPPVDERPDRLRAWLEERQGLVDGLRQGAAPAGSVERALLALILSADSGTFDRLARRRRELAALMRRPRPYG